MTNPLKKEMHLVLADASQAAQSLDQLRGLSFHLQTNTNGRLSKTCAQAIQDCESRFSSSFERLTTQAPALLELLKELNEASIKVVEIKPPPLFSMA